MKTPEEIKKGIECCLCDPMERGCEKCPYVDSGCESWTCEKELGDDTVALIQQYTEDRKAAGRKVARLHAAGGGQRGMTYDPVIHLYEMRLKEEADEAVLSMILREVTKIGVMVDRLKGER